MTEYAEGGWIASSGPPVSMRLDPDECVLDRDARCLRGEHPTATSDCTTVAWIRHTRRCLVHDTTYERTCNGCAADRLAGEGA